MLTDRFKALEEAVAKLPPDLQDALADALEDALQKATQIPAIPAIPASKPSDVRAAIDRALEQHAASLQYLKDK